MQFAWKNAGACYAGQREQALSPQGLVSSRISNPTPPTVGAGLLAKAAGQLASILNVPPSSRASSLPHRAVANTISATTPITCGSEPARDEIAPVPKQNTPPASPKNLPPTALPYTRYQATHPCAFAYNYARIRPLVRLVPGFYCLPATAHQWSGLVARGNRSCTSASQTGPYPVLDGGCTQGAQARRLLRFPGLLTYVQLPPHCSVASGGTWSRGSSTFFQQKNPTFCVGFLVLLEIPLYLIIL